MLEIQNISKTYPNGVKALDDVSLSIEKGLFGLLGPNGAGKSSLMRTIATLQSADEGSIVFDGIDIARDPHALRQRLGYLPQDFGVYPKVSAFNLLNHLAILKGLIQKKQRIDAVNALLEHVNLYQHRKKAVSGFSGGMRQRFGIAQALLGDPDLIIVDEPTAGLDPEERNRFHNLLVKLGEEKLIMLSTHIVDDVAELCSNMAILGQGKILLAGKPAEVTKQIQGKIWHKTVNIDEVQSIEAELSVISQRLFAGQTVLHVLSDTQPEGFSSSDASLQDVYFSLLYTHKNQQAA